MAIQNRRGQYRHFDPSKMVAGEWAVVQTGDPNASNGEAVYMAFEPGKVKRMATYEDMVDHIVDAAEEATEEAVAQATATATAAATTATNQATAARSYARGDTGTRTGEATDNAKYYSEQAASAASTAAADAAADAVADVQSTLEGLVDDAETAATLSESYAIGGTGARTGEDTDNAKYYAELSSHMGVKVTDGEDEYILSLAVQQSHLVASLAQIS